MPNGQTIISNTLSHLGLLEQGGTPSVSDSNYALNVLNAQWEAWGIDENFIYAVIAARFPLVAGQGAYTIGLPALGSSPSPSFKASRPGRIYGAAVLTATGGAISSSSLFDGGKGYAANDTGTIQGASGTTATYTINTVAPITGVVGTYTVSAAGTGYVPTPGALTALGGAQPGSGTGFRINITAVTSGGEIRRPVRIVEAMEYLSHGDLQASSVTPDELYPDYNPNQDGYMTLYLYPAPSVPAAFASQNLELQQGVPFTSWTLGTSYNLPAGFQDALEWVLAWRLMPGFGAAVAQQIAELVRENGQSAEARLMAMIQFNRQKPIPPQPQPPQQSPITPPAVSPFRGMQPKQGA